MRRLILALMVHLWIVLGGGKAPAAESKQAADLDSFLSRSGYRGVAFKPNDRNQPLVEAELAGRHRVFLADSGCTMTLLEPSAAAGLKTLGELGATLDDSFLGQVTNGSIALMDKLVIDRAQFLNQPAKVEKLDMDFIKLKFDGVLGLDFFFRNFCLIDCYRHKLYLRGRAFSESESASFETVLHNTGFTDVPLRVGSLIAVDSKVNDEPVGLLVDTGAGVSALDEALARRLHLSSVKSDESTESTMIRHDLSANLIGFNRIGSHKVWITMLKSFELGPRQWKNISYGVVDFQAWGLTKAGGSETRLEGIFGAELLERHGVLIDFANRKLWLRPVKQGSNH